MRSDKPPSFPTELTENRTMDFSNDFNITALLEEISNPDTHQFIRILDILIIIVFLSLILCLWVHVAQLIKHRNKDKKLPGQGDEDCEIGGEKMEMRMRREI